jgi:hypothetical protein
VRSRIISLLFFVVLLACNLNAQQNNIQKTYNINALTVSDNHYSKKILTAIAMGNNIDLKGTQIKFRFNLNKSIRKSSVNAIEVFLAIKNTSIEGDTKFRNFSVDNLLIPDYCRAKVRVILSDKEVYFQTIEFPSKGKSIIINTGGIPNVTANSRVEVEILKFDYSRKRLEEFNKTTSLINNYFGFSLILDELNKKSRRISTKNDEVASTVFLQWHEVARISYLLSELDIISELNLKTGDPEKFISKTKELKRHFRRATTLLNQTLKKELTKGFIVDKQKYLSGLQYLSETYYNKSKEYQPFQASSFFDAIAVNTAEVEVISKISDYYDAFAYGEHISIPNSLYNMFTQSASKFLNNSKNNMALQQLNNARLIQEYFQINVSTQYNSTLASTLNGIIESYLKVSNMAFKSGNSKMAEHYYLNAEELFEKHRNLFETSNIASTPFLIYIETQRQIAAELLKNHRFADAEKVLLHCIKITIEKNLSSDGEVISLLKESQSGIYNNIVNKADFHLNQKNIQLSLESIYEAKYYSDSHQEINPSKKFEQLSYSVFLEFMQRGEILLDAKNHKEAVKNLLTAKTIQTNILGYEVKLLDELLRANSVPVILDMVEEASFQTWAKRTDEANKLLEDAKNMQTNYHQEDNPELNSALQKLETKIKNRHCMDLEFEIKENSISMEKLIKTGKFEEAEKILNNSYKLNSNNSDCNLDLSGIRNLEKKYDFIFSFTDDYGLMKNKLFGQGYEEAIDIYLKLRNAYFENEIEKYNFKLPSLYDFVKQQNLRRLTYSSVNYFIENGQYQLAFEYLQLLKSQGFKSAESKDLQMKLGIVFANSFGEDKELCREMAYELSEGNKWFKYFSKSMGN